MKNSVPYGVEMRDQVMRRSMWYLQHGENDCKRDERHGEKVFSYLLHEETVIFLILKRNDDESALENGQKARWFSRVIRFVGGRAPSEFAFRRDIRKMGTPTCEGRSTPNWIQMDDGTTS
jgi:hypothetical protein